MLHSFHYNGKVYQHVLASVSWLKEHHAKGVFGKPLEVWWKDPYESGHLYHSFIPIQLLCCHAAYCDIQYEEQCVNLMCPVQNVLSVSQ